MPFTPALKVTFYSLSFMISEKFPGTMQQIRFFLKEDRGYKRVRIWGQLAAVVVAL